MPRPGSDQEGRRIMSDPVRWKDGGGPEGASRLLTSASRPRPMTAAERARTAARAASLSAGAGAGGAAGAAPWVKLLAGAAGIGVAVAVVRALSAGSAAPPAVEVRSSPAVAVTEAPVAEHPQGAFNGGTSGRDATFAAPEETAGARQGPAAAAPISGGGSAAPGASVAADQAARPSEKGAPGRSDPRPDASGRAADSDELLAEAESLERARARISADPAGALALLAEHRRLFPRGQLGAEREVLTIDALSRLGRRDEARTRAEAFLKRHPASPYAAKVSGAAPPVRSPDAGVIP